ncbi:Asp-tRNA(Asn)/Glu-tRNA(Gln) amidotransferase subunit GatA [Spirochaeta isovalerica]|uniref:Glutamyl-tRNA(Gln) amidotransferase subunit A n=1 Tax=Spirochaeta isovalerica TaxID=150 RepID=A0A841RDL6_9SPIO|nr:Asp-tRNA(Asn)/Glu-tRNA(Gln) amidotransferase subunit GatA [Spirochaeta isovalerica]MBB6480472.1 aspartyl-tRNA(Asn)/glutamyl-tRNA(Gln) amidotransferase subunit A [Spirochaeta isovalerica]
MSDIKRWAKALTDSADSYKKYVGSWEEKIGSFLQFDPEAAKADSSGEGILAGIPFGVKDNIAVKGFNMTCGSKILENFDCPYTATAVENLQKAGAVPVGKMNMDEFGMGSSTDNSALAETHNPWDTSRVAGGSSGGSAAAVAAGQVPFALGSDTGGSVRQPASFCGVYGLKPTYGTVSRYGLTAYASSLETIGVCAETAGLTREVFNAMRGKDIMDNTTVDYSPSGKDDVETVAVLKVGKGDLSDDVLRSYNTSITRLKEQGYKTVEVELPTLKYVVPAYYVIATAEASANLARFNGIRYGLAAQGAETPSALMEETRHSGFGDEVKLRILLGTYVLRSGFQDQYYHRAQKIRTAILNDFNRIFESADALMMPVFPTAAFRHGSSDLTQLQQKAADLYTCSANLAGLPALAVPSTIEEGLPVGVQFMAPAFEEERLFRIAEKLESVFPAQKPEGYSQEWKA